MSAPFGRPPFPTKTTDNVLDEIEIIESHIHGREHWFGISADQSGDNWGSDTLLPFVVTSGDGDYKDKTKLLGTDDTPIITGETYFDLDRILVTGVSENTVYKIRIIWGTGTMIDAISNNQFTEVLVKFDSTDPQLSAGIPFDIVMPRLTVGILVWAQVKNLVDDATLSFFIGLHGYAE